MIIRKINLVGIVLLLFVIMNGNVNAQWQSANGVGGTTNCLASYPNSLGGLYIFAGTTNGVIRSSDNGLTWKSVGGALTSKSINAIAACKINNGKYNLYAGTGVVSGSGFNIHVVNGGVSLSTDDGETWTDLGLDSDLVTSLAAYPNGSGACNLFAGNYLGIDSHLFLTTNNGVTWTNTDPDSFCVWSLSSYLNSSGRYDVYAASGQILRSGRSIEYLGGAYRTSDDGTTWNRLLQGYTICIAVKDSEIYAGTYFGLYYSPDNGKSWSPDTITVDGWPLSNHSNSSATIVSSVQAIPDGQGGTIILAGIMFNSPTPFSALVRSTDNGQTWTCPISRSASAVAVPDGAGAFNLFAAGEKLLCSNDNGSTWVTSNVGLSDADIAFLASVPNNSGHSDLVTSYYPNFLLRSSNDGVTWEDVDTTGLASGLLNPSVGSFASTPNNSGGANFYIGCYGKMGNLLQDRPDEVKYYESTNYGSSWDLLDTSQSRVFLYNVGSYLAAVPNSEGKYNLLQGSDLESNLMTISTDNGSSWESPNGSFSASGLVVDDSTVYGLRGNIYYSTDGGWNWKSIWNINATVTSFAARGNYLLTGTKGSGVFLSTDKGTTWTAVNNGSISNVVADFQISSVAVIPDGTGGYKLFAAACPYSVIGNKEIECHLFLSTNLGASWGEVSNGLPPDGAITHLVVKSDTNGIPYLYAGFGLPMAYVASSLPYHGIWRRPLSDLVVGLKGKTDQHLISFTLGQNYPNPFNPSTSIRYSIPQAGFVTMNVYDILGRVVSTLISKYELAGEYSVNFNAVNIKSGVYFYQLRVGNYRQTKKMIILK